MTETRITIFNDGKEKSDSYEATILIDFDIDDQYEYARGKGCRINTMLELEHVEYGENELEALQNLNCSISYLIERLTSGKEAIIKKIREYIEN